MLGEHNITYRPRTSVKGQILADFLIEKPDEAPPDTSMVETPQEPWILFQFTTSNNEAEYEALIASLRITTQMGVCNVHVSVDFKLVANQDLGTYVAKEENIIKYLEKAKSLVLVELHKEKSIHEKEVATVVEEDGPTWMTPITEYLKDMTLPNDRKEARKLCIKAKEGKKAQIFDSPYGLLYEVDRGKSYYDNHRQSGEEVCVGKQSVPLRPSRRNSVGQRATAKFGFIGRKVECVAIREAKAKLKMTEYYNARARGVTFKPGDFVYCSNDASHAVGRGKLGPKWEGPYEITEALGDGAYRLRSTDGTVLPQMWNIANLKKCYL
ncbi:reverse transcriptase domain-containing protein [Tanacetum coccineum]